MKERKLIICRGIQGSGKSTWAKQWCHEDPENRIRFNNDDIRNMLGDYWEEKIKELCLKNNARAYISPNRRNAEQIALAAIQQYAQLVSEGNAYQGYRVYDSACGSTRARGYKPLWVVDVDSKDPEYLKTVITLVNECRGAEENKVRYQIPTLHGYHLITIGFDVQQFSQKLAIKNMDSIDIQKDNPTLLYYAAV